MSKYLTDREFTDYVHKELAIPKIYNKLSWDISEIDPIVLSFIDTHKGIDYILKKKSGHTIFIQERFRDSYYSKYNDATLRFRRELNTNPERIRSEFYKIEANYLVYGITNGSKFIDKRHTLTDFIKWVIIDLDFIKAQFEKGKIKIITSNKINSWIKDDILYCPENFNSDGSSSFIPFDILLLKKLFGSKPILCQVGYF